MTIISEIPLRNFQFWSGGKDRAEKCTDEQLDEIESMMEDITPGNGWTETEVNDFSGLNLILLRIGLVTRAKNTLMLELLNLMYKMQKIGSTVF